MGQSHPIPSHPIPWDEITSPKYPMGRVGTKHGSMGWDELFVLNIPWDELGRNMDPWDGMGWKIRPMGRLYGFFGYDIFCIKDDVRRHWRESISFFVLVFYWGLFFDHVSIPGSSWWVLCDKSLMNLYQCLDFKKTKFWKFRKFQAFGFWIVGRFQKLSNIRNFWNFQYLLKLRFHYFVFITSTETLEISVISFFGNLNILLNLIKKIRFLFCAQPHCVTT